MLIKALAAQAGHLDKASLGQYINIGGKLLNQAFNAYLKYKQQGSGVTVDHTKGQGLKLAGQGLNPAGGNISMSGKGLNPAGGGWKTALGSSLIGLGAIGAAGNIGDQKPLEGIIGGSILGGIGAALIHADRKKKKQSGSGMYGSGAKMKPGPFQTHMYKHAKKHSGLTKPKLKQVLAQHGNKPIGIKGIFGSKWKEAGHELTKIIEAAEQKHEEQQSGSGLGGLIKKGFRATTKKLKQFAAGKTKFKPSDLADYLSYGVTGLGVASSLIPGVDIVSVPTAAAISTGLKTTGQVLKKTGRGMTADSGTTLTGQGMATKQKRVGTKREVWNGTAHHTASKLVKDDLMKNKRGKIVSKKQHAAGQRAYQQNNLKQYENKFSKR